MPEDEREDGRKQIHNSKISFPQWLAGKGGRADVGMAKAGIVSEDFG